MVKNNIQKKVKSQGQTIFLKYNLLNVQTVTAPVMSTSLRNYNHAD